MGNCDACRTRPPVRQITFPDGPVIDGLPGQMVYFVCDECSPEDDPSIHVVEFRFDDDYNLEAMLA